MVLYNRLKDRWRFFKTSLGSQKRLFSLDDSICDFLLYFNNRLHLTTKVTPYKAIMDVSDNEVMGKIKKNTLKGRLKAKTVTYPDGSNVRISNLVKIIDKQHLYFDSPRGLKKSLIHWKYIVIGKVIYSRRNYCKIKIQRIALSKNN